MYDKVGFPEGKYAPFRKCPKGGGTAMKPQVYGCGLEAALAVVGGKWKPIVLWQLAPEPRRFGELRRLVTGISEKMLIQQLREMEADGIVHRKVYHEVPPKVEYSLTAFGVSLDKALTSLCEWGNKHIKIIGAIHRQCELTGGRDGQESISTTGSQHGSTVKLTDSEAITGTERASRHQIFPMQRSP
jgi:DNA-binding HxlR family transcriptional regulator